MKKLSCKDMGMSDDFTAKGETEQAVIDKMMEHAQVEHKDMVENMSPTEMEEMKKKMKENMQDKM
jgi:predicted small metal-binding protein